MYRYMLQVRGPEGKLDERAIKAALDRRLLFASRPVTFRFGKMAQVDSMLLVELATDRSREELLALLQPAEAELGIGLESAGWGWVVSDQVPTAVQTTQASDPSRDPYAPVLPQQAAEQVYTYGMQQALGLYQTPTVIKTIAVRAALHYVGNVPRKGAVYRCYKAA